MKIALLGAHPSTLANAPYKDRTWEIWCCSSRNMGAVPRHDLWFELHEPLGHEKYVSWLAKLPRVMVRTEVGRVALPHAHVYPEEDMRARFGPYFFTSSIAYMLALALSREPDEIGLWGVEMAKKHEYEYQRPGCHYFIQKARDAGIRVSAPASLLAPQTEQW